LNGWISGKAGEGISRSPSLFGKASWNQLTAQSISRKDHVGFARVPFGKHTKSYGKIHPSLIGKSTINGHVQ